MKNENFFKRVKEIVSNPVFEKPISELNKDYTKRGVIILVTRIKPKAS